MATIFRAPIVSRLPQKGRQAAAFDPPNILLATLVLVAPFAGNDWRTPHRAPYVHREFDPPNLLASTLAPAVTLPFIRPQQQERSLAWPPKAAAFDPPNTLLSELVLVAPFKPIEWRGPERPVFSHREFDPPDLLLSNLQPSPLPPAQTLEPQWPSATPRAPKAQAFDPPNLILNELVPTRPFFEPQWYSATRLPRTRAIKAPSFDPPNLQTSLLFSGAVIIAKAHLAGNQIKVSLGGSDVSSNLSGEIDNA